MQRDILAGKNTSNFRSVKKVHTVPKAFTGWADANCDRIMPAKALPYYPKNKEKIIDEKWVWKDKHRNKMLNETNDKTKSYEDKHIGSVLPNHSQPKYLRNSRGARRL